MNPRLHRISPSRVGLALACAVIGWATSTAALLLAARSSAAAIQTPGLAGLDALLATAAGLGGLALLSWLAAGFAAAVLDLSRDPMRSGPAPLAGDRGLVGLVRPPQAVRRLAAFVLGLALAAGTAGPASAAATSASTAPAAVATAPAVTTSGPQDTTGGAGQPVSAPATEGAPAAEGAPATWTPDRPAPTVVRRELPDVGVVTAAPRLGAQASGEIAVRRGDTLWSIAARQLGSDARADEVARTWPLWWHANRGVIGEDPDLIHPGQVLVAPTGAP